VKERENGVRYAGFETSKIRYSALPKGAAPEDFCPHTMRLSRKNMMKHTPGNVM
jgi:hypothetical protein